MNRSKPSLNGYGSWRKAVACVGILLLAFALLQSLLPLRTAVQIGADEGFELAKVTLCAHGHQLYTEIWNDQPPLHTFLVTQIVKHVSHSVLAPRLVTSGFTVVLLISLFFIIHRLNGPGPAVIAVAILIGSPGFLELSASCMLEIPALAAAMAGLCILANFRGAKALPEVLAGTLFGAAILIKLISLVWTPLAVLLICHQATAATRAAAGSGGLFSSYLATVKSSAFIKRPLAFAGAMVFAAAAIDWLVDHGAYWANFRESWQSHFSAATTSEYGSASEHKFDWTILLRNWDATVPAIMGTGFALSKARFQFSHVFPLIWLGWSLLVFASHTPWWPYYYIHTAIPLCWLAALGIWWLKDRLLAKGPAMPGRRKKWKHAIPLVLAVFCSSCAVAWMSGRVYLQIATMKALPRTFSSLVITETERYRPFTHWLYADDQTLSYHIDIPMPPSLAVVPLKRFWSGGMTADLVAEEFDRYRPELAIVNNANATIPFRELLNSNYRLVYQDDRYQLYVKGSVLGNW